MDSSFWFLACFYLVNTIACHTGNELFFFFARPRLLAGRCWGVTVFPDSVPLRGLALGRFHDAGIGWGGRVLDAACDPGTRPLHFRLGLGSLIASSVPNLLNLEILTWGCLRLKFS